MVGRRIAAGRVPTVQVAPVTRDAAAARSDGVPVLSGVGYVVSADRYISIGVTRRRAASTATWSRKATRVKAGDPLVQLDARDYSAAVDARSRRTLRAAQAEADLAKAEARARARRCAGTGVMSQGGARHPPGRGRHRRRRASGTAEAELDAARVSLEYTTLRAPRSGVILAKLKEVGEIAVPGGFSGSGDLIRMANLEDLRGQVDVTESRAGEDPHGPARRGRCPTPIPDRRYAAHVVKLYPQVDRQKGTLRIEVQIEKPDEHLWPDMSARITFLEPSRAHPARGRAGPAQRRAHRHAGRYAWVLRDGRVQRTPITTGPEFADQVQVTAGLAGGEQVVIGDTPPLEDGQEVHVAEHA